MFTLYSSGMTTTIRVNSELHREVRQATKAKGLKLSFVTEKALRDWLRKQTRSVRRKAG